MCLICGIVLWKRLALPTLLMVVVWLLGAHVLSGNVFEPRALNELLPDWRNEEVGLDSRTVLCVVLYIFVLANF